MLINELIEIEKELLKIENEHKFDLSLNELIFLKQELKRVGEITSLFFDIQYEYSKKPDINIEDVKAYHDKLSECKINVDVEKTKEFIKTTLNKS